MDKNTLIGAGIVGALALGGYSLVNNSDPVQTTQIQAPTTQSESGTDYYSVRTSLPSGVLDRDCGDFSTHAEAQAFFDSAGPGDPHGLDRDKDGEACETLP